MRSHEIDYEIFGDDMQIVEIELDPEETVVAEAGAMNYMEDGIEYEAKMGDGSEPSEGLLGKLMGAGKRVLTGESIFLTHFTNRGSGKRRVAFAAPYPGKIIPLDLSKIGGTVICQKDAFLCAALGTKVSIAFQKRLGAGFFGGEGFILQRLEGDGKVFIHAGGTIVKKKLQGENLRVDTGCLVAFTQGINYDIQTAGNLKSMFFGGEGAVPGFPFWNRLRPAAEPAFLAISRPDHPARTGRGGNQQRRGISPWWPRQPVRRLSPGIGSEFRTAGVQKSLLDQRCHHRLNKAPKAPITTKNPRTAKRITTRLRLQEKPPAYSLVPSAFSS